MPAEGDWTLRIPSFDRRSAFRRGPFGWRRLNTVPVAMRYRALGDLFRESWPCSWE